MNILLLDTETTDIVNPRIVQLAYKNVATGTSVNEFFNPPSPISFMAMAVHHITPAMVADKPAFYGSNHQTNLLEEIKKYTVVAHNAPFDIGVLKNEGVEVSQYIDTLRVARHVIDSEHYRLQYLRYFLQLEAEGAAHNAWGDVVILEALFNHLVKVIGEKFKIADDDGVVAKMIELTKMPVLLDMFGFGKYKGKKFADVGKQDPGYISWLYNSETQKPTGEQNEELVFTLKQYLPMP